MTFDPVNGQDSENARAGAHYAKRGQKLCLKLSNEHTKRPIYFNPGSLLVAICEFTTACYYLPDQ